MDAAGVFLVDLEDLSDAAVLPIGGEGAGVFERQAVLVDASRAASASGTSFCAPTAKMTLAAPQA
jgi:hypothetical protein